MNAARVLRHAIRRGDHTGLTTGHAPGFVQANLVVLPHRHLADFLCFCDANAAACPVLGVGSVGDPGIPALGDDIDVRTDLPAYLVHRGGHSPEEVDDIGPHWRDDLVAVAIGCWFSMEDALVHAGVRLRHVEMGIQGPLFVTGIAARGAGIFRGPLVVSMRPFAAGAVATVRAVTSQFVQVHGAPLHAGDAAQLGIADLGQPDFGEVLLPLSGEVPLYWPCGLTALLALRSSGVDFFATHAPGRMLVTDRLNTSLVSGCAGPWIASERALE